MTKYICKNARCWNYNKETTITGHITGKFCDDAWGRLKEYDYYEELTDCCNKEDFEEIKED